MYVLLSSHQNGGQNYNIKKSIDPLKISQLKYFPINFMERRGSLQCSQEPHWFLSVTRQIQYIPPNYN
jgi:hypothetical protein